MPQIQSIREQYQKGSSVAELSRTFGVDPKTIRKYVNQEDFSPRPPEKVTKASILDPLSHASIHGLPKTRNDGTNSGTPPSGSTTD